MKNLIAVAWNVTVVLVALAIVDQLKYDDVALINTSLSLILLSTIQIGLSVQSRTMASIALLQQDYFVRVFRKIGDKESEVFFDEDSNQAANKLNQGSVTFAINILGSAVIYVIAVTAILGAVWSG